MKYIKFDVPITEYYFFIVLIWRRHKDFIRANGVKKSADACWQNCPNKNYPLLGEFHFVKGKIGVGMVAHEVTHAAASFARKMSMKKNEEYLCETAQTMTINIWNAIRNNKTANKWVYKNKG